MQTKEDLKTVALGTSKINYLDPRITVAWCKRHEVPIEKVSSILLNQTENLVQDEVHSVAEFHKFSSFICMCVLSTIH